MDPVVFEGVQMNLEPRPRSAWVFGGAERFGVRSWNAILDGMEGRETDKFDEVLVSRRHTAL